MQAIAYCFASGHIEIGATCPQGSIPLLLKGEPAALTQFLAGVARRSYDNKTLLVPGVPEAPDQAAGVAAGERFIDNINEASIKAKLRSRPKRARRR